MKLEPRAPASDVIAITRESNTIPCLQLSEKKQKTMHSGYFMSDNNEPGGIENATHNTFLELT
jgi:hypothetical protein